MKLVTLFISMVLFFLSCGGEKAFVSTFPKKVAKTFVVGPNAPKQVPGGVLFSWKADPNVKSVHLAGTMNGWDKSADPMKRGADGIWRIVKKLSPDKYFYKYVENGSDWYTDRDNPHRGESGYENAIIRVGADGSVHIKNKIIGIDNRGRYYKKYTAVKSADWIKDAVVYELFARTFSKEGFNGIRKKLPYLKDLGVNTLWLMPIHPIGKVKRKGKLGSPYAVLDYFEVNPEFGTKADFKNMVDAAHKSGMRVIIDWVANHSAWDHKYITARPDFYTKDRTGKIISPMPGWSDVADFNYGNPAMRAFMHKALIYWVKEFGIDGYRMDTAAIVPLDFWRKVRQDLLKIKPDVLLLAESDEEIHHVGAFDLTYEGAIRNVIKKIAMGEKSQYHFFRAWEGQKYSFPKNALRLHWLENHDQPHALQHYGDTVIYPASAILLTLEGPVLLLMGQEFGDIKWQNNNSLFDPLQLSWNRFDKKLFSHYRSLCRLRGKYRALSRGTLHVIENDNKRVVSYLRKSGNEMFLVVVSLSPKKTEVVFHPQHLKRFGLDKKVRMDAVFPAPEKDVMDTLKGQTVELAPYGSRIFRIQYIK